MYISQRTGEQMVPVLYCDLDGTVRKGKDELGRFVNGPEDVELFDGVADLLWEYKTLGWRIVSVSNQGGIALGHMSFATCKAAMVETYRQSRNAFDKMLWCSHFPGEDLPPEMAVCWCRKPRAGMIIEGALALTSEHPEIYPPHLAIMVGDRNEDVGCAENAGVRFIHAETWRTGAHLRSLQ